MFNLARKKFALSLIDQTFLCKVGGILLNTQCEYAQGIPSYQSPVSWGGVNWHFVGFSTLKNPNKMGRWSECHIAYIEIVTLRENTEARERGTLHRFRVPSSLAA